MIPLPSASTTAANTIRSEDVVGIDRGPAPGGEIGERPAGVGHLQRDEGAAGALAVGHELDGPAGRAQKD